MTPLVKFSRTQTVTTRVTAQTGRNVHAGRVGAAHWRVTLAGQTDRHQTYAYTLSAEIGQR